MKNNFPNIRQFITSVVLHRKRLLKTKQNCKNIARMNLIIEKIYNNWLCVYKDANEFQLANFFITNQEYIKELMPGKNSTNHSKYEKLFTKHWNFAMNLTQNNKNYFETTIAYYSFYHIIQSILGPKTEVQVIIHNVPAKFMNNTTEVNGKKVLKAIEGKNKNTLFLIEDPRDIKF